MGDLCARPERGGPRLFPPIATGFLESSAAGPGERSPAQEVAARLIALADRPMSRGQRVTGRGLDSPGRLGRVLWLFREGVRSEVAGRWGMANFYWRESAHAFRKLIGGRGTWEDALRSAGGLGHACEDIPDADAWLRALVDEVFVDTHCAFFNGRVLGPGVKSPDDRAFDHARFLRDWLLAGPTALTESERLTLIGTPWRLRLQLARDAKRWDLALEALEQLRVIDTDRGEYLDRIVEIECQRTFETLKNGDQRDALLADASALLKGIAKIETFRRQHPYNLIAFEALGQLHHVRAIKLANAGRASDAMIEARMALDHAPTLEGGETTLAEIEKLLKSLIERTKEIRREMARHPGASLNEDGRRLCDEADKGFKPFNAYVGSSRPGQVAQALLVARNRDVWRRVGLPPPPDRFDERASALVAALLEALRTGPADEAEAGRAWAAVAERDETLRAIPPALPARFLTTLIPGHAPSDAPAQGEPHPPAESPPVLEARADGRRGAEDRIDFWLFSRRDLGAKALAVAAAILLAVGTMMAARRVRNDRGRDDAYARVVQSRRDRDRLGVIRGIEAFLAHPPAHGRDPRDASVRELYDEEIVKLVIERGGADDAEIKEHVERFRRLTANPRS